MRSLLSTVLIALVAVLTPLSALAVWADREIGDTDGYVAAMAPLATDPEVTNAVADRITNEVTARLASRMGGAGENDSGGAAGAAELRDLVHDAVLSFAATEAYRTAWDTVNQAAHTAVENALTSFDGRTASVDLAPVAEQLKAQLSRDGVPYADRIPVGDTRTVVLESERLGAARGVFDGLQHAGVALSLLTVLLAVAALLLAPRGLPELALALAVGGALLLAAVALTRQLTLGEPPMTLNRPAAGAAFDALTASLRLTAWALIGGGVLVATMTVRSRRKRLKSVEKGERENGMEGEEAEGEAQEVAS
ncbi:hypothetical protein [Streptomyces qinzhouensis]|uniref:hypothetical protein n=1 Tax=Streptomyces qinzhouensis TaxID=2599401 RepID=UPI001FE5C752|nr:hypothetical protein [Streptomyces qinzhouensis]